MPDNQFLEERESPKAPYVPSQEELENRQKDQKHIDAMYEYRRMFEQPWLDAASKWNQFASEDVDNDVPNFVVPISRMSTHTGIVSMRQSLPEVGVVPGGLEDRKKADLIKDASAHVDRMTNMEAVMDQFMVDYAVLGNGVLEDFVKVPYKTFRKEVLDENDEPTGKFTEVIKRDWSRPKIGTRARSPWECAFDPNARSVADIRACTFQDRISYNEFVEQYVRRPKGTYQHTEFVEPGIAYDFNDDGDLDRIETDNEMIIIQHYQNEIKDIYRIYANGVMILDDSLSSHHRHGKCTLTLVPNHHKYDKNKKSHALYGAGDPELLEDLDDLVNAMTNMFIDNYQKKNTYVVGIDGGGLDPSEVDYLSGDPVSGRVSIQSLGQADLPEFANFKQIVEDWAVQAVKKNYKRLEGETANTAFEAAQKKQAENVGMLYQIKKMESGGLLEHMKKRVSDIMEHMTIEEWEDITEEDLQRVQEMVGIEVPQEDIVLDPETKRPIKMRYVERFKTRGRVYEEVFINGKRHVDGLREVSELEGEDGYLPATKEYLWTREFALFGHIPDLYLVGSKMIGEDTITELAKLDRLYQHISTIINLRALESQSGQDYGTDWNRLFEKTLAIIDIPKEDIMGKDEDEDVDPKQIEEQLKAIITQSPNVQAQPSNAGGASPVTAGPQAPSVPIGGVEGDPSSILPQGSSPLS